MNLHRAYFTQALQEMPNDLASHRYLPSVMATYRSAWRLIEAVQRVWENIPSLLSRFGLVWGQGLSAAVSTLQQPVTFFTQTTLQIVMCLLVTRSPNSRMTESCLVQLDAVATLYEKAAPECKSANNLLVSVFESLTGIPAHLLLQEYVQKLRTKAQDAVSAHMRSQQQPHAAGAETDDRAISPAELDRIGGGTHLINQLGSPPPTPPRVPPSVLSPSSNNVYNGASAFAANFQGSVSQAATSPSQPAQATADALSPYLASVMEGEMPGEDVVMHSTVAEDMRGLYGSGDMGYNIFDFPPTGPLPGTVPITPNFPPLQRNKNGTRQQPSPQMEESLMAMLHADSEDDSGMSGTPQSTTASHQSAHTPNLDQHSSPEHDFYRQNGMGGVSPGGTFAVPTIPSTTTGHSIFNPTPVMLDATWQSFVEQLGF